MHPCIITYCEWNSRSNGTPLHLSILNKSPTSHDIPVIYLILLMTYLSFLFPLCILQGARPHVSHIVGAQ